MKLNRKELRKIQYDFNSYSNRLLQADSSELEKLIASVRAATDTLASAEEKEVVSESLEVIEVEAAAEKPKKINA